jgi:hypothetical protein
MEVAAIVELLEFVLRTMCFQGGKFCQQKEEMAKGSTLSSVVSKIIMEHLEELAQ